MKNNIKLLVMGVFFSNLIVSSGYSSIDNNNSCINQLFGSNTTLTFKAKDTIQQDNLLLENTNYFIALDFKSNRKHESWFSNYISNTGNVRRIYELFKESPDLIKQQYKHINRVFEKQEKFLQKLNKNIEDNIKNHYGFKTDRIISAFLDTEDKKEEIRNRLEIIGDYNKYKNIYEYLFSFKKDAKFSENSSDKESTLFTNNANPVALHDNVEQNLIANKSGKNAAGIYNRKKVGGFALNKGANKFGKQKNKIQYLPGINTAGVQRQNNMIIEYQDEIEIPGAQKPVNEVQYLYEFGIPGAQKPVNEVQYQDEMEIPGAQKPVNEINKINDINIIGSNQRYDDLQEKLNEKNKKIEEENKKNKELREKNEELKNNVYELKKNLSTFNKMKKQLNKAQNKQEEAASKNKQLNNDNGKLNKENKKLNEELNKYKKELEDNKKELQKYKNDSEFNKQVLLAENEKLSNENEQLNNKNKELNEVFKNLLEEEKVSAENIKKEYTIKIQKLQNELKNINNKNNENNQIINNLQNNIESKNQENNKLNKENNELKSKIQNLKEQIGKLKENQLAKFDVAKITEFLSEIIG